MKNLKIIRIKNTLCVVMEEEPVIEGGKALILSANKYQAQ